MKATWTHTVLYSQLILKVTINLKNGGESCKKNTAHYTQQSTNKMYYQTPLPSHLLHLPYISLNLHHEITTQQVSIPIPVPVPVSVLVPVKSKG